MLYALPKLVPKPLLVVKPLLTLGEHEVLRIVKTGYPSPGDVAFSWFERLRNESGDVRGET